MDNILDDSIFHSIPSMTTLEPYSTLLNPFLSPLLPIGTSHDFNSYTQANNIIKNALELSDLTTDVMSEFANDNTIFENIETDALNQGFVETMIDNIDKDESYKVISFDETLLSEIAENDENTENLLNKSNLVQEDLSHFINTTLETSNIVETINYDATFFEEIETDESNENKKKVKGKSDQIVKREKFRRRLQTIKKSAYILQTNCGAPTADFIVIMKDNLISNSRNKSKSNQKYIIFGHGALKDLFLTNGINTNNIDYILQEK